ncbi:MAG: alpha-N-arabinofuranosidase, partial [Gemmiger qucibialis]
GPDREDSGNQYIANMRDGAVAGFKYFAFKDAAEIKVHCTGSANGRLQVSTAPDFSTLCADIFIKNGSQVGEKVSLTIPDGTYPLYFRFTGSGKMNFHWFELQ